MIRWRRSLLAITPLVLGVFFAAGIQGGGPGDDPRNTSDAYFDAVNNAECLAHHQEDGFIPFGISFVNTYTKLPIGEPVDLQVRIQHVTQYEGPHQVMDMTVTVDTQDAANIEILDAKPQKDIHQNISGTLEHAEQLEMGLLIGHGATNGHVTARVVETDPPLSELGLPGQLALNAAGEQEQSNDGEVTIELDRDFFQTRGQGEYSFQTLWRSPHPLVPTTAVVEMELVVNFTEQGTEFTFPAEDPVLASIGQSTIVTIPVKITSEDEALLDFRIRGVAYWAHAPGDGAPVDAGVFHRFMTLQVTGGDQVETLSNPSVLPAPYPPILAFLVITLASLAWFKRTLHPRKDDSESDPGTSDAPQRY